MLLIPPFFKELEAASDPMEKANVLLITGMGNKYEGHIHQHWSHENYNSFITKTLSDIANVTVTEDLSTLNSANLKNYHIIINNGLFKEPNDEQFDAFKKFIESGKSYLAIHAGLVSFLNQPEYEQMIGGRFIAHEDIKTILVSAYNANTRVGQVEQTPTHSIMEDIEDFKTLDELYIMDFNRDDIEVIARAEAHPIMWTREMGKGKIVGFTLGHFEHSHTNDGFQRMLRNSVLWLSE